MRKILIAEDEVALRSLMAHLMTSRGFHVTRTGNGLEAWEEACKTNFDLVITDAGMPLLSGEELIEKLQVAQPNVPVLLVSADRSRIRSAIEKGLNCAFLAKPFRPADLVKQVERMIGREEEIPLAPSRSQGTPVL
ncbi:MAG: response regulator [Candidatus Eremiobacteraeota bacterium]|nr:response regulator [Candidatus Eremiobacteraeota bacterium]